MYYIDNSNDWITHTIQYLILMILTSKYKG